MALYIGDNNVPGPKYQCSRRRPLWRNDGHGNKRFRIFAYFKNRAFVFVGTRDVWLPCDVGDEQRLGLCGARRSVTCHYVNARPLPATVQRLSPSNPEKMPSFECCGGGLPDAEAGLGGNH
jgi:hypothetical protein